MSKHNKSRPGYKKTKVGWIPDKWELVPLGQCAEVLFSNVDKKSNDNELPVKLCNYTDVYYNKLITNNLDFMRATATKAEIEKFSVNKGDVIITKDSETADDIAVPAFVVEKLDNVLCGYHLALIRPNSSVLLGEYLSTFFQIHTVRHYFSTLANGITRFGLTTQTTLRAQVPLPSLPEQKKIAEILSAWDRAIEQMGKLINAKTKLKKALMQQLLTGKLRIREFKKPTQKKESFPEGWEVKPLGSFGSFLKGKGITNSEKKETGFPCITYGEIYTKYNFILKEFHSFIDAETAQTSQRIKNNDILFAGSGETLDEIGKCVAFTKDIEAYAGGDIVIFRPDNGNSIYLSYVLNSDFITRYRRKLGQGHSVVHIYSSGLKTLQIPLPSLLEQKKIAKILSDCDREVEFLNKKREKFQGQKKGLMQKLLTGNIRVIA